MAILPRGRPSSRDRILEAAGALAVEVGPGNMSLEAVAERAGLSKGGLLYNFPTKAELMRALVACHVEKTEAVLAEAEIRHAGSPNPIARAYVEAFREGCAEPAPALSGILVAIAEDPELIAPVRRRNRQMVDRIAAGSDRPELALLAFLAVEGLRAMQLFETDPLTPEERRRLLDRLNALLDERRPENR